MLEPSRCRGLGKPLRGIPRIGANKKLGDCLHVHHGEEDFLRQIREFYHTLVKVNKGYYKAKVNEQTFYLRLEHIVQLLGVPNDRDKT